MNLPQMFKIVDASGGCVTTSGAITCDYVSLKNVHKAWIVCAFTQAAAHATVVQPQKATAVAPTGAASITVAQPNWVNAATATTDTLVRGTDATAVTLGAAVAKMMVVIEIDPASFGTTYDVLGCTISASGEATNFVSVQYWLETRYPQATPPAAITD